MAHRPRLTSPRSPAPTEFTGSEIFPETSNEIACEQCGLNLAPSSRLEKQSLALFFFVFELLEDRVVFWRRAKALASLAPPRQVIVMSLFMNSRPDLDQLVDRDHARSTLS